jgi:hypothetical protein
VSPGVLPPVLPGFCRGRFVMVKTCDFESVPGNSGNSGNAPSLSAAELLEALRADGLRLWLAGDRIHWRLMRGDGARVEMLTGLLALRDEVRELLRAEPCS